ncbi:hypothetical protein LEMLEM_LOCUS24166, partial [Lemmus lemmus]
PPCRLTSCQVPGHCACDWPFLPPAPHPVCCSSYLDNLHSLTGLPSLPTFILAQMTQSYHPDGTLPEISKAGFLLCEDGSQRFQMYAKERQLSRDPPGLQHQSGTTEPVGLLD